MKKSYVSLFVLSLIVIFSGCIGQQEPKSEKKQADSAGYTDITASKLKEMMENEKIFLIDTHIPEQQHIRGTNAFIPFNEINTSIAKLPDNKDAIIVVYCRSGSMSAIAASRLAELGYTSVYNLLGGTSEWRKAGYEFE